MNVCNKGKITDIILLCSIVLCCVLFVSDIAYDASNRNVRLNKTSVTLKVGQTVQLKVKNLVKGKSVKWSTNKKKIAAVNKKGKVTAKAKGTAKIIAKTGKRKYVCKVTVLPVSEATTSTPGSLENLPDKNHEKTITPKFRIPELHSGDAKFYRNMIITSVDSHLTMIDLNGNIVNSFEDVMVSWIDSIDEEGVIVYGNFNNEIGIAVLNDENKLVSNNIIMHTDNVQIDPTINKVGKHYYVTVTEVEGTLNNGEVGKENGEYSIHIYVSDDLKNWEYVSDIDKRKNNLEDVDVLVIDDTMYVTYECEEYDKGNSAVLLKESKDGGKTWSQPRELLPADCDHEPAGLYKNGKRYVLYYSCDKEEPGASYMGARAYAAVYDAEWRCKQKDIKIPTKTERGILWYDYQVLNGKEYYLFAKDYCTTNDMVVEWR